MRVFHTVEPVDMPEDRTPEDVFKALSSPGWNW